MVTLDWSLERSDGVTLVGLVVAAERPCRVRVENRLDGPVWPPRRHGQPTDGWEDGVFAGEVPATGRLTVGYATPAPPAEPPAEVAVTEPATDLGRGESDEAARASPVPAVDSTPSGVVRALGDPVVPRDGVPIPAPGRETDRAEPGERAAGGTGPENADGTAGCRGVTDESGAGDASRRPESERPETPDAVGRPGEDERPAEAERLVVPSGVRTWLRDVEARLDADADGRIGRPDRQTAESALVSARAADRQALRRVRQRADALLARAERADRAQCGVERAETGASDGGATGR